MLVRIHFPQPHVSGSKVERSEENEKLLIAVPKMGYEKLQRGEKRTSVFWWIGLYGRGGGGRGRGRGQ